MHKIHRTLHLQHHRHTGRLLHHRHTSYRSLALVLGLAAAAIFGLNMMARATADSLYVYASVPAQPPSTAPVITNPPTGSTTKLYVVTVSGTCPLDNTPVIIELVDNGKESGSTVCNPKGTFSIPIALTPGNNEIVARGYSITGDRGPDSQPVHVKLLTNQHLPAPLSINPGQRYIVYGPLKMAEWTGVITGGEPPYLIHIDWGDGATSTYHANAGKQRFSHHYASLETYTMVIEVVDKAGAAIGERFAVVTPYHKPPVDPILGTTPSGPLSSTRVLGLYISYLLILAAFGTLWKWAHPFAFAKAPPRRRHTTTRRTARRRA